MVAKTISLESKINVKLVGLAGLSVSQTAMTQAVTFCSLNIFIVQMY